jgi:hypothetical protein
MALRICHFSVILYYKWEIDNQFDHLTINFPFVMQNDWKTANFARLYYPHFTTFRNETSEYYYFCDALSSCDEIFVQTCLDQNFTHKGKGLLRAITIHYSDYCTCIWKCSLGYFPKWWSSKYCAKYSNVYMSDFFVPLVPEVVPHPACMDHTGCCETFGERKKRTENHLENVL